MSNPYSVDTKNLKDNVPKVLINLFKDALEDTFKLYREGDPGIPNLSQLPAMFITEPDTGYDTGPTGHDELTHEILIQVVFNKKDDFGNPDHGSSLDHWLDAITQGRDVTTGKLKDKTVMGVLRKNLTLGNLMIDNIGGVKKGIIIRSEELTTAETQISVTLKEIQEVSGRT